MYRLGSAAINVVALTAWLAAGPASAGQLVGVALASGRVFVGEVDPRSDDTHLWLKTADQGITVRRPIEWGRIVSALDEQGELSQAQLHQRAHDARPMPVGTASRVTSLYVPEVITPDQQRPDPALPIVTERPASDALRVCSIALEAYVGNWDRTVEADGIVLHVYPLDEAGWVVPVNGALDVELIAMVPPGSPRRPLPRIARWSTQISAADFGPSGAVIKLPFQAVQPEFDLRVGPFGLVHVRLSVPGNASFEASQAMVRIRQYSIVRDQAQQNMRRRFFDVDRVNRW